MRRAGPQATGIPLSLSLQHWGDRQAPLFPAFPREPRIQTQVLKLAQPASYLRSHLSNPVFFLVCACVGRGRACSFVFLRVQASGRFLMSFHGCQPPFPVYMYIFGMGFFTGLKLINWLGCLDSRTLFLLLHEGNTRGRRFTFNMSSGESKFQSSYRQGKRFIH